MSVHLLGAQVLPTQGHIEAERTFIVGNGDMAPVSDYVLKTKGIAHGYIEGTISQISDKKPVSGAEIQIRIFNEREKDSNLAWKPYLKTLTDEKGHYRVTVPMGQFTVQCKSIGRPLLPLQQMALLVNEPKAYVVDLRQTDLETCTIKVIDADTKQPIPAKVSFTPVGATRPAQLGAPWKAQGARYTYYLKPGENKVPVLTGVVSGKFHCVFSRGPEYDIAERDLTFFIDKPQTIVVPLKRVVPTPGMVSVDLNLPTRRSPFSRTSPEDIVLAAAGEGVQWIFSGDMNEATDLSGAIKSQGLEKFIRASVGVHLSFQYPKLFGEFYVFPVPKGTTAEKIKALATPRTRPAEFFKAVRKAFPGALIAVMKPSTINTSYLTYYNMDMTTGVSPFVNDFSLDFDAIETYEGKSNNANQQNWNMTTNLIANGHPKITLASSLSTNLLYEEPGYSRMYLVTSKTDPFASLTEQEAIQAIKDGKYFITNGPIIQQYIITDPKICELVKKTQESASAMRYTIDNGKLSLTGIQISKQNINEYWPNSRTELPNGEFVLLIKVSAAPWVKTTNIYSRDAGNPERQAMIKSTTDLVRFPFDDDSRIPFFWLLHAPKDGKEVYRDTYITNDVLGDSLAPVVTRAPHGKYSVFAVTPPVMMHHPGTTEETQKSNAKKAK